MKFSAWSRTTNLCGHQIGLTQLSWFMCLDNISQATQEKNPNKNNNPKSACGVLHLIASWQVSVLNSKHTDRHWHCSHELMGAGSGTTSAHHGGWRRMSSNITTERQTGRERRVGHNSPWCKVQDRSFLPAVLFHLRLTLAAAQSNMPLCWRGRVMGTCFFFFLAKALSWDV